MVMMMTVAVCVWFLFPSVLGSDNGGGGMIEAKVCYIYISYIFFFQTQSSLSENILQIRANIIWSPITVFFWCN